MGHPQKSTEIITDNSTEDGIIRGTMKQIWTKAMEIRFYWVRDRAEQKQFEKPGQKNFGNYFTKHNPATHQLSIIQTLLVNSIIAVQECILRGCAKTRNLGSGEHGA